MNKLKLLFCSILLAVTSAAFAQTQSGSFNESATGTKSATAFVPSGLGDGEITDLSWRLDNGVSSGFVSMKTGRAKFVSTSVTGASGTVAWFSNAGTQVAAGDYIIIEDVSSYSSNLALFRVLVATTTSVTTDSTITPALATNDLIWWVPASQVSEKAVANTVSNTGSVAIWCPGAGPTAVTIDGNTTACRIQISGVRTKYK